MYDYAVALFGQWRGTNPCLIDVSTHEVVQMADSNGQMEAAGYVAPCINNEALFIKKLYLEPHHQGRSHLERHESAGKRCWMAIGAERPDHQSGSGVLSP